MLFQTCVLTRGLRLEVGRRDSPEGPCAQIVYTLALKYSLYGYIGPKYILFGYMDP